MSHRRACPHPDHLHKFVRDQNCLRGFDPGLSRAPFDPAAPNMTPPTGAAPYGEGHGRPSAASGAVKNAFSFCVF